MKTVQTKLRVSHFAQVPCKPFSVEVENEFEAMLIDNTLANQHLFLFDQGIIPDYSNAIVVEMLINGGWEDYFNEDEGMEWDEFKDKYLSNNPTYADYLKLIVGF